MQEAIDRSWRMGKPSVRWVQVASNVKWDGDTVTVTGRTKREHARRVQLWRGVQVDLPGRLDDDDAVGTPFADVQPPVRVRVGLLGHRADRTGDWPGGSSATGIVMRVWFAWLGVVTVWGKCSPSVEYLPRDDRLVLFRHGFGAETHAGRVGL